MVVNSAVRLFASIVVVILLAGMVLGTSVTVMANPPNTSIYLKDRLLAHCTAGLATFDLPPGFHALRFTSPGYFPQELKVEVDASPLTINVELLPLAWLEVESSPTGAIVAVDGLEVGKAPTTIETSAGTRTLCIKLGGYLDASTVVYLEPFESEHVELSLIPKGLTIIESKPPGAKVSIDGSYLGITPLQIVLESGEHRIALEKVDYFSFEATMVVKDSTVTWYAKKLIPKALLTISGLPQGAIITLDSTTTLRRELITTPGRHELVVEAPGYSSFKKIVELKPGRNEIQVSLIPRFYELSVSSTPSAIVQVDDLPYALSPCTFKVAPGVHDVVLFKVVDGSTSVVWKDRALVATDVSIGAEIHHFGTLEIVSKRVLSISDGEQEYPVPTILHLREGVWKFTATTMDGATFDFWARSKPGTYQMVDLDDRLISYISVVTPTSGATVSVDGKFVGHTPLMGLEILPGPHAITVVSSETSAMKLIVVPTGENMLITFERLGRGEP